MISGVVTSPNFQSSGSEYTIQDATAGLILYGSGITDLNLWLGDEVIVSGITDEYNGKFEIIISSASDVQILGTGTLPEPQIITVSDLYSNGELYESELITIENVTTDDDWPSDGSSANLTISDGGSSTTTMRIDSDTDIDGSQEPTWPLSVTGIVGFEYMALNAILLGSWLGLAVSNNSSQVIGAVSAGYWYSEDILIKSEVQYGFENKNKSIQ